MQAVRSFSGGMPCSLACASNISSCADVEVSQVRGWLAWTTYHAFTDIHADNRLEVRNEAQGDHT